MRLTLLTCLLLTACGGATTEGPVTEPTAGAGGTTSQGGSSGSSGTSGQSGTAQGGAGAAGAGAAGGTAGASAAGGTAGASAAGGAAGAGAAGGAAGASAAGGAAGAQGGSAGGGGALPACGGPADGAKSAVCVTFAPETMALLADDPQLDGQGVLYLAAYDTPLPDGQPGVADDIAPLRAAIFPPDGQSLVGVTALPTLRLDGLPPKVYLRALFFDNAEALAQKEVAWGVWLGGNELGAGFTNEPSPLTAVDLTPGAAQARLMTLTALRRLEVTISLGAGVKPLDDAQGPLRWLALAQPGIEQDLPFFGVSDVSCRQLTAGPTVVRGFFIGSGDRFVLANLDDFGLGPFEPGTLTNLEVVNGAYAVPAVDRVSVGASDYRVTHSLTLGSVIPLSAGQPAPAPYACP